MPTTANPNIARALARVNADARAGKIDPARLQKWIELILQFLPVILSLFKEPSPPPTPAPVQAAAAITTIDGLLDYVQKTIELHNLSDDQQAKVLAAVEALAAFLTM
jgi:hypothetical protein